MIEFQDYELIYIESAPLKGAQLRAAVSSLDRHREWQILILNIVIFSSIR
jgi:hypothetical protein